MKYLLILLVTLSANISADDNVCDPVNMIDEPYAKNTYYKRSLSTDDLIWIDMLKADLLNSD